MHCESSNNELVIHGFSITLSLFAPYRHNRPSHFHTQGSLKWLKGLATITIVKSVLGRVRNCVGGLVLRCEMVASSYVWQSNHSYANSYSTQCYCVHILHNDLLHVALDQVSTINMRTPRRSPRAALRSSNKFSIKSILSSTPRSRKRRAALARTGPKKCLAYAGVTDRSKMDSSERFPEHDTSECCAGDRSLVSTTTSSSGAISGDERWIQALRSSALHCAS